MLAVCDDLNQKLWECIIQNVLKPISFNISLCIYLNICHYFARAFFIYVAQGQADTKRVFVINFCFCCSTLVMLQIRKITILKFSSLTKFHNILKLLFSVLCVFVVAILSMLYKEGCKGNNKSQSYLNWMMNFYLCFHCADVLFFIFLSFFFLLGRLMIFSPFVAI